MRKKIYLLGTVFSMMISFLNAQYLVTVYNVTSDQPAQPGAEVGLCIDGDTSKGYHSKWNYNAIPNQLNFYFVDIPTINKIEYVPRSSGTNGIWTKVTVSYSTKDNPTQFTQIGTQLVWAKDNVIKTIDLSATPLINPSVVRFDVAEGSGNFSSCAEMRFYSDQPQPIYAIDDCAVPTDGLVSVSNKVPVIAAGTSASSEETVNAQTPFGNSFDGDTSTLYHSNWDNTTSYFPVTLIYHFDGTKPMDYLRYIPRLDGNVNGLFGKVSILYNTNDDPNYVSLMDYDFMMNGKITDVQFPNTITPANIKILVNEGKNDFVSCAEIEFYPNSGPSTSLPYGNIFANSIYSELNAGVTQADIDGITDPFYKGLAQCIFNGTYNKKYRVQSYEVYPEVLTTANELKTSSYDQFENMTGIAFQANSKIALFLESSPAPIVLRVRDFANEANPSDKSYTLNTGLNVIDITTGGLAYVSYYNNNAALPPVKLNIVSGAINGYYDINTSTPDEWQKLVLNKVYSKIDLRGKYAHLVFDKEPLRVNNPESPIDIINRYDNIVRQQRILMGMFKYNKSPKNHMFAWTESKGGWFAIGMGAHFDLTWGAAKITSVTTMDPWGISHEFGHVNQIRPNLKWAGQAEVTNNVYSTWADYTIGTNMGTTGTPRLEGEVFKTTDTGAALAGGKLNKSINYTVVGGNNIVQAAADKLNNAPFLMLGPFWQLELYYQLAGAGRNAPILTDEENPAEPDGIDYAHWYGYVSEKARTTDATGVSHGQLQMDFVINTCDAVQEDLTDFFKKAGFLKPIDADVDDYGVKRITVTQEMIDATIAAIKAKNYSAPVTPVLNYINSHTMKVYRDHLPISGTTGNGVTLSNTTTGAQLKVDQVNVWKNVVAYEVYDTNNNLARISLAGVGDTTNKTTVIEYPTGSNEVYAVGYDGSKILVYPTATLATAEAKKNNRFVIYPNPSRSSDVVRIELPNSKGNYTLSIYSMSGSMVLQTKGNAQTLNENINKQLATLSAGMYLVIAKDENGEVYNSKLIKN